MQNPKTPQGGKKKETERAGRNRNADSCSSPVRFLL
jgi:hypothetical protein